MVLLFLLCTCAYAHNAEGEWVVHIVQQQNTIVYTSCGQQWTKLDAYAKGNWVQYSCGEGETFDLDGVQLTRYGFNTQVIFDDYTYLDCYLVKEVYNASEGGGHRVYNCWGDVVFANGFEP